MTRVLTVSLWSGSHSIEEGETVNVGTDDNCQFTSHKNDAFRPAARRRSAARNWLAPGRASWQW